MTGVPKWRIAAGVLVLLALLFFAAILSPIYLHAFQLREFVSHLNTQDQPDDSLRRLVLAKSRSLDLPVNESGVQITRTGGEARIQVRYRVKVDLPGYTAELHF